MTRYFVAQDNDSHWYLVPVLYREAWNEWVDIPSDDERAWVHPYFAKPIDGPHRLTFADPKEG